MRGGKASPVARLGQQQEQEQGHGILGLASGWSSGRLGLEFGNPGEK